MPFTGAEMIGIVSGSSLIAAMIGAWASRKAAQAENEVARFEAIVNALDARIEDLKDQLDEVRRDLHALRSEYEAEVNSHQQTRSRLRLALDHIRAMMHWLTGDPDRPHPKLPPELQELL